MKFVKSKASIKYWILALVFLGCIYTSYFSRFLEPIFDNIYYGNLVKLFTSITNFFIWLIEFLIIFFVCKKLKIELFSNKETLIERKIKSIKYKNAKNNELPLWRVICLFVLTIAPMIIISIYLNFKIKLVYLLGIRVTSVGLACNVAEILSYSMKILLMILIVKCVQTAVDINFELRGNFQFAWGGLFLFLTVGLIDFFLFPMELRWFYLLCTFLYGVIYLFADKKFSVTYILSYLIWLL